MYKQQLSKYFDEHFEEILKSMKEIMSIDSTYQTPIEGKPFGEGSAKALEWGANFGKSLGLKVKNFDNYAISMDFKDGDPKLGILSHLDVVPISDGWHYPPFDCTVDGDKIYGRGAIDDKGPSVAVLYAVKAIKDLGIPIKDNFRIIFGGNEEGGCGDIEYYQKKEDFPPMVFTPDGTFPVLNCEKGMMHLEFSASFEDDEIAEIVGGTVINAIPNSCEVTYKTGEKSTYTGVSAHGSRPDLGDNAITQFTDSYNGNNKLILGLQKLFNHEDYSGKSCGLGFSDDLTGEMSCALTLLNTKNGRLHGGIDIRFPIDRTLAEISGIIKAKLTEAGFEIDDVEGMEPHHVPEDSLLVQALLEVYEEVKGEKGYCVAEGGITYVHNTEGGVAFGAEFVDENNNMHGADEHISIETFKYNLNMYANAIIKICGEN